MAVRCGGGTVLASGIRTRERKERKLYSDDWALGDEEIEGHHNFNLDEKITNPKFNLNFIKDMTNIDFTLSYIQKNGFNWPLLFKDKKQLGIVIPENDFSINDVRISVGSKRMLDVMDVNTQKNVEMTMKDWQRYYESQDKDKLLNVISLEFSHTKLETLVEAPSVVRQIDWVEKVWPRHLKEAQTESTNVLEDMMYPKVQKYCLMSVSGCYTDFHIDFGGTSVWYHILRGKKIFWLIPPSERNLQLYEQWVLSGKQSDIFFGDTVEKCARVKLDTGDTFFIPTGWIHAVYTPDDSLVFGGNFLHSFGIEKQLRVANVEDITHVPQKFRYPFFTEMLWYLLERYVHVLLGRTHLSLPPDEQGKYEKAEEDEKLLNKKKEHIHLTQYELHGLKAIVMFLHALPTSKKSVPELIKDPIALIRDVRTVVEEHRYDSADLAVTNIPVLDWWSREPVKFTVKRLISDSVVYTKKRRQSRDEPSRSSSTKLPPNVAKVRHRRVRCKECDACTRDDCRECVFCRDMTRYGGQGTMKQTCKFKKCFQPNLPAACLCVICEMDGWMRYSSGPPVKIVLGEPSLLYECSVCYKISHIKCSESKFPEKEGAVNEDYPNSWECPECIHFGYNQKSYKYSRVNSSRLSSAGSDANVKSPSILSETDEKGKNVKVEPLSEGSLTLSLEREVQISQGDVKTEVKSEVCESSDPSPPQMPTWEQLQERVSYPLVKPCWVVRPAPPVPETNGEDEEESGEDEREISVPPKTGVSSAMAKTAILKVFSKLSKNDLLTAMRVCKQWSQWANDPLLWEYVSVAHKKVTETHLHGIVRRQPNVLCLDWSSTTYEQFLWLLPRLPQLSGLHCVGVSWGVLRPLISPYCPLLSSLDLSSCEGVDDNILYTLLKPPPFHRPGHRDTSSRLRQLTKLKISGTEVGDSGIAAIVRSLPFLTHLDISNCPRVTHYAAEHIANPTSLISHSLTNLDIRGCHRMSPLVLPALSCLPILSILAIDPCEQIPLRAIKVWGQSNGYTFDDDNIMTRTPPKKSAEDHMPSSDEDDPELIYKKLKENCNLGKNTETNLKLKSENEIFKTKTYHADEKENYFVGNNTSKNSTSVTLKETDSAKTDVVSAGRDSIEKQISSAEQNGSVKKSSSMKKDNSLMKENSTKQDSSKKQEVSLQNTGSEKKILPQKLECSGKKKVPEKENENSSENRDNTTQNEVTSDERESTFKEKIVIVDKGDSDEGVKTFISSINNKTSTESTAKKHEDISAKKSVPSSGPKKEKKNFASEYRKDKATSSNTKLSEENVKIEVGLDKSVSEDDISCDNLKLSEHEGSPSESCRRSERSNKGSKYKINIVGKKQLIDRKESEDETEAAVNKSEDSESEENPKPSKKKTIKRNSPPPVFKRKLKKKIITRSKSLRIEIPKCSESDIENLKLQNEEKSSQLTIESENQVKPRIISSKVGGKYITKLRKKHKDGKDSSKSRALKTAYEDEKQGKKKLDESTSKKPKAATEYSATSKKDSVVSGLPAKKRKEREGSSSSSSSSSSQSPLPSSFHSEKLKKLKVELEPIGKLCRRRSEGHKISSVAPCVQSSATSSPTEELSTPASDKCSSRDRPERQHRSPRRLSMCQ